MMRKCCQMTVMILLAALLLPACAYYKPAFRGRVVDAETGDPIEGAVVVVSYSATRYTACCVLPLLAGAGTDDIHAEETLTDRDGMFRIPPYVAITLPITSEDDIDLAIFKPGYGSFPRYRVNPPPELILNFYDRFFSKDFEKEVMVEQRSGAHIVTFGVVRLPKLDTWEDRRKSTHITIYCDENDCPLLHKMLSEEEDWLDRSKGWRR